VCSTATCRGLGHLSILHGRPLAGAARPGWVAV
jgi:hypothetical protein